MAKKRTKKTVCPVCKDKNPFVGIAGAIGGIYLVIVVLFLAMAEQWAGLLVPIAVAMCIMGIFLGYFASKKK